MSHAGETLETSEVIAAERLRRKRQVALGYRIFASLRWGDLGDGHITARDPEHTDCMWMLDAAIDFGKATVKDLVLIDPDGRTKNPDDIRSFNNAGYRIHHPIHELRPDVISAAHCHTPFGTSFASECRIFEPISQESTIFFEDMSIYDGEEVQVLENETGYKIAEALGPNRACVLRNHGLLTAGQSVAAAVSTFVTMERVAEVHMKARNPQPISAMAAHTAKADLARHESLVGGFLRLVDRHVGDRTIVDD